MGPTMTLRNFLILTFGLLGLAQASLAEMVLVPPSGTAVAGSRIVVTLYVHNPAREPKAFDLPRTLNVRYTMGKQAVTGILEAEPVGHVERLQLPAEGFRKFTYSGVLPENAQGPISMELIGSDANRAMFMAQRSADPGRAIAAAAPAEAEGSGPTDARTVAAAGALSVHEPMYFIAGSRGESNAKFQLSFKYRFINPDGPIGQRYPGAANWYFGYTQTSLWDLDSASKPFRDTSYRPSLFYFNDNITGHPLGPSRLGLQAGLEHESNGKDGPDSRSINIAFVRPTLSFGDPGDYHLSISPKLWVYLDRDDNRDIDDYRGYFDLQLKYGKPEGWQLSTNLRKGEKSDYGSVQVDLSYPLTRFLFRNMDGYFLVQYFNGYGESLLDYNQKLRSQFRVGFAVVR